MLSRTELSWGVLVWLVKRALREWALLVVKLRTEVGWIIKCRLETLLVRQGTMLGPKELCLHPHPQIQIPLGTVRTQEGHSCYYASIRDVAGGQGALLGVCLRQGLLPLSEGPFRIALYRTS